MRISFIEKMGLVNPKLEELIKETIGDGSKDIFIDINEILIDIDVDNYFSNTFKLGECEIEGIKAVRKIGAVYLTDDNLGLMQAGDRICPIIPSFKYTKGDITRSTLNYIQSYSNYKLEMTNNNGTKKELYIMTYVVAL